MPSQASMCRILFKRVDTSLQIKTIMIRIKHNIYYSHKILKNGCLLEDYVKTGDAYVFRIFGKHRAEYFEGLARGDANCVASYRCTLSGVLLCIFYIYLRGCGR